VKEVTPDLVLNIAQQINQPVLYMEIGNRGFSYEPGPIDIVKQIILARPEEPNDDDDKPQILQQSSWLRDNKLNQMIHTYGINSVVVCYNSVLKRTVFSLPRRVNVVTEQNTDQEKQHSHEYAILKLSQKRIIRNAGLSALAIGSGVYFYKILLPMIMAIDIPEKCATMKKVSRNFSILLWTMIRSLQSPRL
jgi:hypothetical protein